MASIKVFEVKRLSALRKLQDCEMELAASGAIAVAAIATAASLMYSSSDVRQKLSDPATPTDRGEVPPSRNDYTPSETSPSVDSAATDADSTERTHHTVQKEHSAFVDQHTMPSRVATDTAVNETVDVPQTSDVVADGPHLQVSTDTRTPSKSSAIDELRRYDDPVTPERWERESSRVRISDDWGPDNSKPGSTVSSNHDSRGVPASKADDTEQPPVALFRHAHEDKSPPPSAVRLIDWQLDPERSTPLGGTAKSEWVNTAYVEDEYIRHGRHVKGLDSVALSADFVEKLDYTDKDMFQKVVDEQTRRLRPSPDDAVVTADIVETMHMAFVSFAMKFESFIGATLDDNQTNNKSVDDAIADVTPSKNLHDLMRPVKPAQPISAPSPGPVESRWNADMQSVATRYIKLHAHMLKPQRANLRDKASKRWRRLRLWVDEWDHDQPDQYHEASSWTRFKRNIPWVNGDKRLHLECQFAMMELLLDLFTRLSFDFSINKAWDSTFTVNMIARIREHINLYLSQYSKNRLWPFSKHFARDLRLATITNVGAAFCTMIAEAGEYLWKEGSKFGFDAPVALAKSIISIGMWLGDKIMQRRVARGNIGQISREWEEAEKEFERDEALFIYSTKDRPNGLRIIVPEIAMHVAISNMLRDSPMQLASYLRAKVGGAEEGVPLAANPGGTAGIASGTETKGV